MNGDGGEIDTRGGHATLFLRGGSGGCRALWQEIFFFSLSQSSSFRALLLLLLPSFSLSPSPASPTFRRRSDSRLAAARSSSDLTETAEATWEASKTLNRGVEDCYKHEMF